MTSFALLAPLVVFCAAPASSRGHRTVSGGYFPASPWAVTGDQTPYGSTTACKERLPELPAAPVPIEAIRITPMLSRLNAGSQRCLSLEVRSGGKWYSVTLRPEARFCVADSARCLVQAPPSGAGAGATNVFGVPRGVSQSCNGASCVVEAEFLGHRAEARIQVLVTAP